MRLLFICALLGNYILYPCAVSAQSFTLTKKLLVECTDTLRRKPLPCTVEQLAAISDSMFKQGNPRYIWVDLLKDGHINNGDCRWHSIQISPTAIATDTNSPIPLYVRNAYVVKWLNFVTSMGEPIYKYSYSMDYLGNIDVTEMLDTTSDFRKSFKQELHRLHLTHSSELTFLKTLIADGLAPADKALQLDFSQNGFYVHGKRLNNDMRRKYMNLLTEAWGINYYERGNSLKIGSLPGNTLEKRIQELELLLASVHQKKIAPSGYENCYRYV